MSFKDVEDRIEYWYDEFDDRQRGASDAIVDQWNATDDGVVIPLVNGPPGTGKTTVGAVGGTSCLLEYGNEQISYLCPTHAAAEEARRKFIELGFNHDQVIRLEPSFSGGPSQSNGVITCKSDLSDVSSNVRRRISDCEVLISTLHGSRRVFRARGRGSRLIVDEFSQVSPPLYFTTLRKARRENINPESYSLLGDPNQLPVVTTQEILRQNIGTYIMRREPHTSHELKIQHRMHDDICQAVNSLRGALNAYSLQSSRGVKDRNLTEFGYNWDSSGIDDEIHEILDPDYPFVIVNTDGLGGGDVPSFNQSWMNPEEARFAVRLAEAFRNSFEVYDDADDIPSPEEGVKILTPYSGQFAKISEYLSDPLRRNECCMTIYKAQGKEFPCVIISFVRDNPAGWVGFLQEPELRAQTYVACSRAQAKLIVLMSFRTFLNRGHRDFDSLHQTETAHIMEGVG